MGVIRKAAEMHERLNVHNVRGFNSLSLRLFKHYYFTAAHYALALNGATRSPHQFAFVLHSKCPFKAKNHHEIFSPDCTSQKCARESYNTTSVTRIMSVEQRVNVN